MIDVDYKSRDSSLSFPPPDFIKIDFLKKCSSILEENGMICINYGTHLLSDFEKLINELKNEFPDICVFSSKDINKILCLFKSSIPKNNKKKDTIGCIEKLVSRSKNPKNIKRYDFGYFIDKSIWY